MKQAAANDAADESEDSGRKREPADEGERAGKGEAVIGVSLPFQIFFPFAPAPNNPKQCPDISL